MRTSADELHDALLWLTYLTAGGGGGGPGLAGAADAAVRRRAASRS